MPNALDPSSAAIRMRRPAASRCELDALEPRLLLSGASGHVVDMSWFGTPIQAVSGSWVLTFGDYLGHERATAAALYVAGQLGLSVDRVGSIAEGRYALLEGSSHVHESAVRGLVNSLDWLAGFEPNRVAETYATPNDPLYFQQWALENIGQIVNGQQGTVGADANLPPAWDLTFGSEEVIVAIIDTGMLMTHPDLSANVWVNPGEIPGNGIDDDGNGFVDDVNGWDFGEFNNDPTDTVGHGTQVAGIIGAVGNNGLGISGVAWNVKMMPLKVTDAFGFVTTAGIVGAHEYITMMRGRGHNIVVSNNSYGALDPGVYGGGAGFAAEQTAIQSWLNSGGVFVAAAGNNGTDNDQVASPPATYNLPGIISVAATDNNDALWATSNFGASSVTLGAPGVGLLTTTLENGYSLAFGTSFSAAMVTGAVALIKSLRPEASSETIRQVLVQSSRPTPSLQGRVVSGGRLDVAEALRIIGLDGPVVTNITPGPVTGQLNSQGQPLRQITVEFNKNINPAFLSTTHVTLRGAGADGSFDTGDDYTVPVSTITLVSARVVRIDLNLATFPQQRLPLGQYRLTLAAAGFRDFDGNFLNGDIDSGAPEVYIFRVINAAGGFEPNDTLVDAEVVNFSASGTATYSGLIIGDGVNANLDVDIFRLNLPSGALIRAQVNAQNRPGGSTLDSYLRLFNAAGTELAANDQYNGNDSLIDFFVTTGGVYYVGVSGFGNANYDPTVRASGSSQSLGVYDLVLSVSLVQDDRITISNDFTGNPLRIPPQGTQGTTSTSLFMGDNRVIRDVNVRLTIAHTFTGDLRISLISPQGTTVNLVNRRGGSGDNFTGTLFDDEATVSIASGAAPFDRVGGYRPEQSLSVLDGQLSGGSWTLLIQDQVALNSGFLLSWAVDFTLETNIFGPFESNDTLATANNLNITGSGAAQRQAVIGDGAFGLLDRDLFRFVAVQGSTLTAQVNSGGSLNAALRLFDVNGSQIVLSNPDNSNSASIESFVFAQGGTYYLGVSAASNVAYDPNVIPSGSASTTTGTYTLNVVMVPGVTDTARVLDAANTTAGVANDGTFGAGTGQNRTGISFQGFEFLFRTSDPTSQPSHLYTATVNGFNFANDGSGLSSSLPVKLTDQSDTVNRRMAVAGDFRGLRVERSVSFGETDSFLVIDVVLTNTTNAVMNGVSWMEAFNPEQGVNFIQNGSSATSNDIVGSQPFMTASFTNNIVPNGLTIALAAPAADSRAFATFYDTSRELRDPTIILNGGQIDPNGATADLGMAMAYNLGAVNAGQSVSMRYFILLGRTTQDVANLYSQMNNGTGTGHLAANRNQPATEVLSTAPGDAITTAPTLPYRVYYAEGFASSKTSTFVPILNPHNQPTRVVVIARYETGARDQVLRDFVIDANSRGGLTLTDPNRFAADTQLVRKNTPYAIEIRSSLPVAANFSHYDLFQLADARAAVGESFTNRTEETWTFGNVTKAPGVRDYLLFQNTTAETIKITVTFFSTNTGQIYTLTRNVDGYRRSGIDVRNATFFDANENPVNLPNGSYGVLVEALDRIVAVHTHYDRATGSASGQTGTPGRGATIGAVPEGQIGLNAASEKIGIVNANSSEATVLFSFLFQNGTSYRTLVNVPAFRRGELDVTTLPSFPSGQPYSVFFESNVPVSMSLPTGAFGDEFSTAFSDKAYTLWGFGEGFRPRVGNTVKEYLRLFNPAVTDVVVEITMLFDGGLGQETFRRTIGGRSVQEFDIHEFVTGERRNVRAYYGIMVKAATPIVAYMGHFDQFFPGGFGTLGTPLGTSLAL
ncbi:MAG: S8 family serine peptidase [Phycisphaeraceae bacterium]|nr:S8 family serine peptidase [Phycisphaeraceae bacterium]